MRGSRLTALSLSLSLFIFTQQAYAQSIDLEWPCIQALVPEVALAVLWPEVPSEEDLGQWPKDKTIASLAETFGDLEQWTDKEQQMLDQFVAERKGDQLLSSLNQLAEGVVSVANRLRNQYIRGIKRYTRQQISIAGQVEQGLNKLAAMGDETSAARSELEESLKWHERVYDQREQALRPLCDRPVELEEKLSTVMRQLMVHLP